MPGSTYNQPTNFFMAAAASVKKRKREMERDDNENAPIHTSFVPSSLQHLNSPFHYECEYTNHSAPPSRLISPQGTSEPAPYRSRPYSQPSYSRKRRQQPQPPPAQQQQQQCPGIRQSPGQRQHFPSNTLNPEDMRSKTVPIPYMLPVPTSSFNHPMPTCTTPLSPAISPKTTFPLYPTQPRQPYLGGQQQPHQTSGISLPPPAPLLRPCHICHRRPTTRAVLDAYADCELCGERTCYICLRECNGPDCSRYGAAPGSGGPKPCGNHTSNLYDTQHNISDDQRRRKVCSWCSVEGLTGTGREVVRCLDCVRRAPGSVPSSRSIPAGMATNSGAGGGGGYNSYYRGEGPSAMSGNGNGVGPYTGTGSGYDAGPWNFRPS